MELKNKKLLITGGASGIGKIMARKSLERGVSHLVIWDINEEGLSKTKEEFSKFGILFLFIKLMFLT
jgi:all-trans-retinol dehydrogenase (NAD+)